MSELFFALINVDVPTLISVLIWGNFVAVLMIFFYRFSNPAVRKNNITLIYLFAKLFQALGCLCMFLREVIPALLSVNVGNSLMFVSFYLEALMIFSLVRSRNKWLRRLTRNFLALALVGFNLLEFLRPEASLRVVAASFSVVLILAGPSLWLLLSRNSSVFKRSVGVAYAVFVFMMGFRAFYTLSNEIGVLSNSLVQALTFMSMVLLMVFSLPAYLLMMKERSDKIINLMATMDSLTRLPNRYSFLEAAIQVFDKHKMEERALTVLFMDIDDFKKINDTYGHAFGDDVLVRLGGIIRNSLRAQDLYCRYGGEEFVILLPDTESISGIKVTERIMQEIAESRFPQLPDFRFTLSMGMVRGVPGKSESLAQFIGKADQMLYAAKHAGKNRVMEYRDPDQESLS